jgi:hypothetical protein
MPRRNSPATLEDPALAAALAGAPTDTPAQLGYTPVASGSIPVVQPQAAPDPATLQKTQLPLASSARPRRASAGAAAQPVKAFFKNELDNLYQTAIRLSVYKRNDFGKQVYISDYNVHEVTANSSSVHAFLQKFLVPQYGGGTYDIDLQFPDGNRTQAVSFDVFDPTQPTGRPSNEIQRKIEELEKRATQSPGASSVIRDLAELKKIIDDDQKGGRLPLPIPEPAAPKADPAVAALQAQVAALTKTLEAQTQAARDAANEARHREELKAVAEGFKGQIEGITKALNKYEKAMGETDWKDVVKDIMVSPLAVKLMERLSAPPKSPLEDMQTIATIFEKMQPKSNPILETALAKLVEKGLGAGSAMDKLIDRAPNLMDSYARVERARSEGRQGGGPPNQQQIPPGQQQPAPPPASGLTRYPGRMQEAIKRVVGAEADEGRVQAVLALVEEMGRHEEFKALYAIVKGALRNAEKERALEFLDKLLVALVDEKLMPMQQKIATFSAVEKNLGEIFAHEAQAAA